MAGRQWLAVKDVERRALDTFFLQRTHQRRLVDDWAASDVDDHRGRLHCREFRFANQAACFRSQRCGNRDVIAARNHFNSLPWSEEFLYKRIFLSGLYSGSL